MNSDGKLGEAGKRCREEQVSTTTTDRLSPLPEPIIYHILSFLDTKLAVQTAVLSRDWNRAWTHVPVLNLDTKSFRRNSDRFEKFVSKVLSLRYDLKLRKLVYADTSGSYDCSGLPMLTTLNSENCTLDIDQGLVLFANFPCLKFFSMTHCYTERGYGGRIKVHRPHLLSLKLRGMGHYEIEIYAPKLKYFSHCHHVEFGGFFDSAIPALDNADISLTTWNISYMDKTKADHCLNSLFQCLHGAKTLKLDGYTIKILNVMCEILEQQPSPFKRLESLILPSNDLHDKVIDYFLKHLLVRNQIL